MAKKKISQYEETLNENKEQNTLKVEIISNKSLFDILGDTKRVWKIISVLFILVFTVFVSLAFVIIAIKRIYPYSNIKINTLGATTIQNEDKEVIYWLFNTADLWANSGIKVKKGDILTIRASGRSHTAIHHLVRDAENNRKLADNWVSTDGEWEQEKYRDKLRMQYRIFKSKALNALLMQVIPEDADILSDSIIRDSYRVFEYLPDTDLKKNRKNLQKRENYYFIGKEREDLLIHNDGILHFAVNDIVLTNTVIDEMIKRNNDSIDKKSRNEWKKYNKDFFHFGPYPDSSKTLERDKNEMTYYKEHHYHNVWYDDNVGSFLIIIERKSSK